MTHSAPNNLRYKTLKDLGRILTLFEGAGADERGVNEVSKELEILPSKASRMLKTLETEGLFTRNMENGKYRLGARFLQIGLAYVLRHPLRRIILPHLEQAVKDFNVTTGWGIFENGQVIVVDRFNIGKKSFIHHLGSNVPLHSTAYGKIFLAYMPRAEQEKIIDTLTFTKFTSSTISDAVQFKEELRSVREQEFAVDRGETAEDIIGIAAPILNHNGEVAAVMTMSTETSLATPAGLDRIVRYLTERTAFISRQIGYDKHGIS